MLFSTTFRAQTITVFHTCSSLVSKTFIFSLFMKKFWPLETKAGWEFTQFNLSKCLSTFSFFGLHQLQTLHSMTNYRLYDGPRKHWIYQVPTMVRFCCHDIWNFALPTLLHFTEWIEQIHKNRIICNNRMSNTDSWTKENDEMNVSGDCNLLYLSRMNSILLFKKNIWSNFDKNMIFQQKPCWKHEKHVEFHAC